MIIYYNDSLRIVRIDSRDYFHQTSLLPASQRVTGYLKKKIPSSSLADGLIEWDNLPSAGVGIILKISLNGWSEAWLNGASWVSRGTIFSTIWRCLAYFSQDVVKVTESFKFVFVILIIGWQRFFIMNGMKYSEISY